MLNGAKNQGFSQARVMVQVEAIQTMGLALRVMFNINHSISDVIGHFRTNNNSSMTVSVCFKEQKIRGFLRRLLWYNL